MGRAVGLRRWLRPPRRLRLLRPGGFLLVGIFGLGMATLNTGNNLLYLLLGALLGLIVLSGVLSEEVLRPLRVRRRLPRGATAGTASRIDYVVEHTGRRASAYALQIGESGWTERAFVAGIEPGDRVVARMERVFPRRGVVPLERVHIGTAYPFGLFYKSREVAAAGRLTVWPRTDRRIREPRRADIRARRGQHGAVAMVHGARDVFRGLRSYRPGDDPRNVHWRSTARAGELVVREFEAERSDSRWICLDTRGRDGGPAEEAAVEVAAALAARSARLGERFAFAAGQGRVPFGTGGPQLARVLDALAAVRFEPDAAPTALPDPGADCILVTPAVRASAGFADVYAVSDR